MPIQNSDTRALLRLTLVPGFGPILIRRAIETLGSVDSVINASEAALRRVEGIGHDRARRAVAAIPATAQTADDELALAERLGVHLVGLHQPDYPPLLAQIPDAPPLLYVRGEIAPYAADRYPIGVVGSRSCTHYGLEQAERFAAALAQAGLTVISGGARGIDTAAHRAALRVNGRTIAVLGCGLAECYPPDNKDLFDRIADGHGAVVSELPLRTPPNADNFPARNRIISGLSLGVLVIEAGRRSGALITARLAAEDHGREVFALPSRVDSEAAHGSLDLLKSGGAAMATHPDDILQILESPARHLFFDTHQARYAPTPRAAPDAEPSPSEPIDDLTEVGPAQPTSVRDATLSASQRAILDALTEPKSLDELSRGTGLGPAALRAEITVLEIKRRIRRRGSQFARND